jgi:hypothetical protein
VRRETRSLRPDRLFGDLDEDLLVLLNTFFYWDVSRRTFASPPAREFTRSFGRRGFLSRGFFLRDLVR